MTTAAHEATPAAKVNADVAHGGVRHGDNDPDASRQLILDRAVLDRLVPPPPAPPVGQPMCWAWGGGRR